MPASKLILNGWISPEGEIFECEKMGHSAEARNIGRIKGFYCDGYCEMWQRGYIRFYPICENSPHLDIKFHLDFPYIEGKYEPTQKQILSMGRLEKALKKFREEK